MLPNSLRFGAHEYQEFRTAQVEDYLAMGGRRERCFPVRTVASDRRSTQSNLRPARPSSLQIWSSNISACSLKSPSTVAQGAAASRVSP